MLEDSINDYKVMIKCAKYDLLNYPVQTWKQQCKIWIKTYILGRQGESADRFFWSHALLVMGLENQYNKTKDETIIEVLKQYFDKWIKSNYKISYLDNIMNGYTLIFLYEHTQNQEYRRAIGKMKAYIMEYPLLIDGSMAYRIRNKNHVYIDGLGMICPFMLRYSNVFKEPSMKILALTQINNFLKYGMDEVTGLPYHGYDANTNIKYGIIGWGRGVGWLLIALAYSLEYIEKEEVIFDVLANKLIKLVQIIMSYQRKDGLFSWQLTALDGPIDTSGTAMILASIRKGIEIQVLDTLLEEKLLLGELSLLQNTKNGRLGQALAECHGFSQYPQIYGEYPWGLGAILMLVEDNESLD